MRITNNQTTRNALFGLQRSLQQVENARDRATTGLKVQIASDDPNASVSISGADSSLRAIDQYRRNVSSATARLNAEEDTLGSVSLMLERAKELGVGQATATANASTRLVAKAEVDRLIESAINLGNRVFEGEYLFGGDQSATPPLSGATPPFAATPPTGSRRAEVSSGLFVKTNHNATEIFLDTGTLAALDELSQALGANDDAAIKTALTSLDSAHLQTQVVLGESAAQSEQLLVTEENLRALDTSLRTFNSNLQDVDLEQAVSELVARQTAYEAAMLSMSRVINLSLADYLR